MNARKLVWLSLGAATLTCTATAQVPDLLNALDAGGRAMGTGGSLYSTGADTLSTFYNPAGIAFLTQPQVGAAYRNLPKSKTTMSGDTSDPVFDSSGSRGGSTLTHFGYVSPIRNGKAGVFGLSYTVGGYINDSLQGSTTSGSLTTTKQLSRMARADYYTAAYGKANSDQTFSWGVGVQVLEQQLDYHLNQTDTNGGSIIRNDSNTGTGVGVIAGIQVTPKNHPNTSFGLSYRSEINLTGNSSTSDLYDKVPARLLGGVAFRQDGFRGGKDFVIYGAQVMHFFSADNGPDFDRGNQTTAGFGVEYNYSLGSSARIPLRVGYNVVPSGGDGFGNRDAFTFGIGYRPNDGRYTFDINFANPQHGGYDIGVALNYKFGK
jgi:hypothetical protein